MAGLPAATLFSPDFAARLSADLGRDPAGRWAPFLRARLLHSLAPALGEDFQRAGLRFAGAQFGVTDVSDRCAPDPARPGPARPGP